MVRRIQVAPPPSPALYPDLPGSTPILARLGVLFAGGHFGVYELEPEGVGSAASCRLRPGPASAPVCAKAGKALDIAWLPLPGWVP